jgi:hypothetical protein
VPLVGTTFAEAGKEIIRAFGEVRLALVTGLVILPLSLLALGVAMLGAPAFGKGYGWASVALGMVATGSAIALLVDRLSLIAMVGIFALIVFHLAVGWKMYRLSRAAADRAEERRFAAADLTV